MKKNGIVTTIMFAVVVLLMVAIVALGIVTVIKHKRDTENVADTTPVPTEAVSTPEATYTPTPTFTPTPTDTPTPEPKGKVCLDPGYQMNYNSETEPVGPGSEEQIPKMASIGGVNESLNLKQYEWNLLMAELVRDELERRGYIVILTRTDNETNISNMERALLANENNADVLVGIQTDSFSDDSVSGVYAQIAESNNPYAGGRAAENKKLANLIQTAVVEATGAKSRSIQNGNNRLALLNWAQMPACIMRLGYLSNPQEAANLCDEAYRNRMANAICDGIEAFLETRQAQ